MYGLTISAARRLAHAAALAFASFVLVLTANGAAFAETRTIQLYHVHLRETTTITYKRNGRFLADGLKQANWALRDWRESKPTNMDPQLLDMMWEIHRRARATGPIHIIGGYRSPQTNRTLRSRSSGVAENSQHTRGKAIDLFIPSVPLSRVRDAAMHLQIGGVGYYPRSGSPFVHIDTGNGRYWPRINRNEMARIFPQGNTIYVPADGKPLPGYERALASYNQRRAGQSVQMADARTGGRSLLARLFGGGADEAEDNAAVEEAPVPSRRAPAAAPAPARQAPQPAVQVASAPAPRPAALPAGVAMPERNSFDTSARAPTPRAGIPEQTQTAALTRVPVPTFAPARVDAAAAAAVALAGAEPADAEPSAAAETLVAEAQPEAPSPAAAGQLAYAVPTPRQRPAFEAVLQAGSVPLPVRSPEGEAVAAATLTEEVDLSPASIAALEAGVAEPVVPVPSASPVAAESLLASREALTVAVSEGSPATPAPIPSTIVAALEAEAVAIETHGLPAPTDIDGAASAGEGAPLAGKTGRVVRGTAVRPAASPVAIEDAIASRVAIASLVTSPERRAQEGRTGHPKADMLVVDVPVTVLTTGFAPKQAPATTNAFSGSAVNFLPVRKLQ